MIEKLYDDAVSLLCKLIATSSISREEENTAEILNSFLESHNIAPINRLHNNVWAYNKYFDESKPTILLNSHHDTVKPNKGYTRDPFCPTIEDGKLYGLGSNDAGASGVSLLATFLHFYERKDLKYNLCVAITAEEEVSGKKGAEVVAPLIKNIDFAIVGEPTQMNMAIAERGLIVIDCVTHGKSGHAARNEGENAIYKAMKDIAWFQSYKFDKISELFGEVKMSLTVIEAGTQHNVVPAECKYTVDIRVTDRYTNEEVVDIIKQNVECDVTPRSLRLRPSSIAKTHPLVQKGIEMGLECYGSPTTSDQALMKLTSLKMGVGDSARSHSADEFVYLDEIKNGIKTYIKLLDSIL